MKESDYQIKKMISRLEITHIERTIALGRDPDEYSSLEAEAAKVLQSLLHERSWKSMETALKDGEFISLLARIDGTEPGNEHPIIGHWMNGAWYKAAYLGEEHLIIHPIAWMPRQDFVNYRSWYHDTAGKNR